MNNTFFLISIVICVLCSCTNSPQKNVTLTSLGNNIAGATINDSIRYPAESDTIILEIYDNKALLSIHKEERQTVYVKFFSIDYKRMKGEITLQDSIGNIRFNQIVMPDGTMDGPFGREVRHDLPVQGDYLLIVGESLMAGDPWGGDFKIRLWFYK